MKWFKHDISARDSDAVFELIERHGIQGYGFYWVILEECLSADSTGFQIQITETWCKRISKRFNITDFRTVYRMLDTMAEVGVINAQLWADQIIFSSEVEAKSDSYTKEKELAAERKRKQRAKEKEQVSRVTSCDIANVTLVTLSDPDSDSKLDPEENLKISSVDTHIVESQATTTCEASSDLKSAETVKQDPERQSLLATDLILENPPTSQKKSKSGTKSSGNFTKKEKEAAFIEAYNRLKPPIWPKVTSMSGADRSRWMVVFEDHYGGSPAEIEGALEVIFRGVAASKWARTTDLKVSYLFRESRHQDFYDTGRTLTEAPQYQQALELAQDPKALEMEMQWQKYQRDSERRVSNGY